MLDDIYKRCAVKADAARIKNEIPEPEYITLDEFARFDYRLREIPGIGICPMFDGVPLLVR